MNQKVNGLLIEYLLYKDNYLKISLIERRGRASFPFLEILVSILFL